MNTKKHVSKPSTPKHWTNLKFPAFTIMFAPVRRFCSSKFLTGCTGVEHWKMWSGQAHAYVLILVFDIFFIFYFFLDAYIISICEQINSPMNTKNVKQQQNKYIYNKFIKFAEKMINFPMKICRCLTHLYIHTNIHIFLCYHKW